MPDTIFIRNGNTTSGVLDLSDGGYSHILQYNRVTWIIDPSSNVGSIEKIHKKKGSPTIFILAPNKDGDNWTGRVMFAPEKDYEYYIKWTDKVSGASHTHDPKIAVNPRLNFFLIILMILILPGILLALRVSKNMKKNK